jgi:hypothetical protein
LFTACSYSVAILVPPFPKPLFFAASASLSAPASLRAFSSAIFNSPATSWYLPLGLIFSASFFAYSYSFTAAVAF